MSVREKIRLLRLSKNWTQEYVAEKLGIAPNSYGALERGDCNITVARLEEIAQLFEIPLNELVDDNEKMCLIFPLEQKISNITGILTRQRRNTFL